MPVTPSFRKNIQFWLLALVLAAAPADAGELPLALQVSLFKKMFSFSRTLPRQNLLVTVLYAGAAGREGAEKVAQAFRDVGINAEVSEAAGIGSSKGRIIYAMPAIAPDLLKKHCIEASVLSVSPLPAWAERGDVAVALGVGNAGRPDIIINLARLQSEKHEFESNLLGLARVIR